MRRPPRITLTIDRLVLRGFSPRQRDAIAGALQAELQRQLADPAQAFGTSSITCQRAGNAPVDDELKSEADRRPGCARIGPEPPIMTRSAVKALTMAAPAATSSTASGLLQRKCACGGEAGFDGECEECGREKLQRKPAGASGLDRVPPIVHDTLRSPGEQLPHPVRAFFEQRFNHDFGRVRVHCGSKADASARAVDALAYTIGQDVVFGAGRYRPDTEAGLRLIAHELTHTIQQERNRPTGVEAQAAAEIEAEHNAKALATEHEPMQHAHSHPRAVLRQSKKPPLKRDTATDAQNVFWRIVHENFRKDGRKLAGTGYDEKNQGLRISGQSSWTRTPGKAGGEQTVEAGPSPMIMVGSGFQAYSGLPSG